MYHPNFFEGEHPDAIRKDCWKRVEMIKPYVNGGSLLDIGCAEGFYCFAFSGICNPICGFDNLQEYIDKCFETQSEHKTNIDFIFRDLLKSDDILDKKWDTIFYLSTHHHIIGAHGFEVANKIIRKISESGKTMFFDMGQKNEIRGMYGGHQWWTALPPTTNPEKWVEYYLKSNTVYNKITMLGRTPSMGSERSLWKLEM